jgi:hypothetical protein
MAIVDDRGRIGGKVNLIDAVIAVVILGLIPVAFGAYLLFRTPPPTLTEIAPKAVHQGNNLRVTITGQNLRPFLRVTFNNLQGKNFLIGNTNYAIVELPDLEPGSYDVVLWDYKQEMARMPKALTVLPLAPTPTVVMEVRGMFRGLALDRLATIKAGDRFPPTGDGTATVVSVGAPKPSEMLIRSGAASLTVPIAGKTDLPAVVRVQCFHGDEPGRIGEMRPVAGPGTAGGRRAGLHPPALGARRLAVVSDFRSADVHGPLTCPCAITRS